MATASRKWRLVVEGVSCAGCIAKIERDACALLSGVDEARVNFTNQAPVGASGRTAWTGAGGNYRYGGEGWDTAPILLLVDVSGGTRRLRRRWVASDFCLAVAGFAAMNVMLLSVSVWSGNVSDITTETRDLFHRLSALIALPAAAFAGQPFFPQRSGGHCPGAVASTWMCRSRLACLLALGMSLVETMNHATVYAYFDSAIMLLFFLLCGRYPLKSDERARRRVQLAAGNLAALKAVFAHRLLSHHRGELVVVPARCVAPR